MSWLVGFYFNQGSKNRVPAFFLFSLPSSKLSVLLLLFQCLFSYLEIIWLGLCQLTFSFNVGPKVLSSPSVTCRDLSCPHAPVLTVSPGLERHPLCAVCRQGTSVLLTGLWSFIPWIHFLSFHCLAPELTILVCFFCLSFGLCCFVLFFKEGAVFHVLTADLTPSFLPGIWSFSQCIQMSSPFHQFHHLHELSHAASALLPAGRAACTRDILDLA